ncbi:MAG: hypothetical protein R3E82_15755 [Pseudomonadales bacterium]
MVHIPERLIVWLAWITLSSAVFTAFPLGPYGLLGWLAAVGPLLRKLVPAVGARHLTAAVLFAMLTTIILAGDIHWTEIVIPPIIFLFGMLLAPVPISGREGTIDRPVSDTQFAEEDFQRTMAREIGRARRYERPLTLLAVTCGHPERSLSALETAVASVVHIYVQTFVVRDRVLVIAPELASDDCHALRDRILQAASAVHLDTILITSASFPDQELTASGLIEMTEVDLHTQQASSRLSPHLDGTAGGRHHGGQLPSQ